MQPIEAGQVWQRRKDHAGVVILDIGGPFSGGYRNGFVVLQSMGTGRKSRVNMDQFFSRYRYIAASVQADMEGK